MANKFVDHLRLLIEASLSPYLIGWVKKGPIVKITEFQFQLGDTIKMKLFVML